jgi:hypothetical protein
MKLLSIIGRKMKRLACVLMFRFSIYMRMWPMDKETFDSFMDGLKRGFFEKTPERTLPDGKPRFVYGGYFQPVYYRTRFGWVELRFPLILDMATGERADVERVCLKAGKARDMIAMFLNGQTFPGDAGSAARLAEEAEREAAGGRKVSGKKVSGSSGTAVGKASGAERPAARKKSGVAGKAKRKASGPTGTAA